MALIQAVDFLNIREKMSPNTSFVYDELRKVVPVFKEDSPKDEAVRTMKEYILNKDCEV